MKANCYECEWRKDVAGSAHSRCRHPSLNEVNDDPLLEIFAILGDAGRVPPMRANTDQLNIKADPHGVAKGWFNFPWSFDPVWLENCDGFIPKKEVEGNV